MQEVLILTLQIVQETLLVQMEDQKESYPARQTEQKLVNRWTSEYLNDNHLGNKLTLYEKFNRI